MSSARGRSPAYTTEAGRHATYAPTAVAATAGRLDLERTQLFAVSDGSDGAYPILAEPRS